MEDVKTRGGITAELTLQEFEILTRIRDLRDHGAHQQITIRPGQTKGELVLDIRFLAPMQMTGCMAIRSLRVTLDGKN